VNENKNQQQQQPMPVQAQSAPTYGQIFFMWWFHPYNLLGGAALFVVAMLTTTAFSYAVGLERDALKSILGNDLAIAHKTTLFKFNGYRIVRERDTPGTKYSPGEIVRNIESRQRVDEVREDERFANASRIGAVNAKADTYSARSRHSNQALEHLDDEEIANLNQHGLLD
tara:strand:+ start:764 stop:1273 length:510 start_codon:yes stop_codon:yes gene_type:complete